MKQGYNCDGPVIGNDVAPILLEPATDPDGFGGPLSRNVEVMEDMLPPMEGGTTIVDVWPPQPPATAG